MEKNKDLSTEESLEWYSSKRHLYKQLASKVQNIIEELLVLNEIDYHAIFSRSKELESFKEKIQDPKYTNPKEQITDLAGVRIICYVESEIKKICEIIEKNFVIDASNSGDKSDLLGVDKVGYKSVHYVAKLNDLRLALPEYNNYTESKFEIQVRTILQHAWAEIEHDRNYKFSGELPPEIQRRFKLVAGSLELADKEFDRIANEIDRINLEVEKSTKEGVLNFEINSTTLKQFLATKFETIIPDLLEPHFPGNNSELRILDELNKYGLKSLDDFNRIIPSDFIQAMKEVAETTTYPGIIRHIMIINDWKKYFNDSYNGNWKFFNLPLRGILKRYNVPIDEIVSLYKNK